jgi:hypothetical protein
LFPGFVAYHYAVSCGWIPAVLGGLFGPACLLLTPIALAYLAGRLQGGHIAARTLEALFAFVVTYLFAWTAFAALAMGNRPYVIDAVKESIATLCIWTAVFFVGFRMPLEGRLARSGIAVAAALLVGILLHAVAAHESMLGPWLAFLGGDETSDASDVVATYQSVGRSILATGLVYGLLQDRLWKQATALFLSTLGLLLVGSRAHFFASGTALVALTMVAALKRGQRAAAVLLLVALCVGGYALSDLFLASRASEVVDLGESTSWLARQDLQSRAVEVVEESPFLGDFGYHHRSGPLAGYAHNILSAWAGFGAVAFCLYAGMILYALWLSARRVLAQQPCGAVWLISFQLNLIALLLAVASEPIYSSVFPALGWGFTARAIRDERERRRQAASVNRGGESNALGRDGLQSP